MGVYLVTILWTADSFSYLVKVTRNLQQLPRKTPTYMTQNSDYVGRDSYRVPIEYNPHALPLAPNGLCILETYTLCVSTWATVCE
jgi:hypothetical protein